MSIILVSTVNVHRDEKKSLLEDLERECWKVNELSKDELVGLRQLINYAINNRIIDKATDLSYTELINLKNKLND